MLYEGHKEGNACSFSKWELVKTFRRGLVSQFFFKCQACNFACYCFGQNPETEMANANATAVMGCITAGIGYSQLQELLAAQNIKCMSNHTFTKLQENLGEKFCETALFEMKAAGREEHRMALERGDVINSVPYIPVVADGSWMKRSYGTNYNSLSGVGAIVGYYTRKVLFIGIRNKYCSVCVMHAGDTVKAHRCFKNWNTNATSTAMEKDAVAEGFRCSYDMHGLIYHSLIADGDSSVYKTILSDDPYRVFGVTVKKIECTNHLLRNMAKGLQKAADLVVPVDQRIKGIGKLRQLVKSQILTVRREIQNSINFFRAQNLPHDKKVDLLSKDIQTVTDHVFGDHEFCDRNQRNCSRLKNDKSVELKKLGFYEAIRNTIVNVSLHSNSLIYAYTNNAAEQFNSIICKTIAGKRINFGQRGAYNARVSAAVVQHNTQQVLTEMQRHISPQKSSESIAAIMEKRRQAKCAHRRLHCKTNNKFTKAGKEPLGEDRSYGTSCEKPLLTADQYQTKLDSHWQYLNANLKDRDEIERNTREQASSLRWKLLRSNMLTASNFGSICCRLPKTPCAKKVKELLYGSVNANLPSLKYGREKEGIARIELEKKLNKKIQLCGLFIDQQHPYLGASPDGLIDEDGIVEIKCPYSARGGTVQDAVIGLPRIRALFQDTTMTKLKESHNYYYQIQGALHVTQRKYCIFSIWTPYDLKILHVNKDDVFWFAKMEPKLTQFYINCMLPEIIERRHEKSLPIKEPDYILEAQNAAKLKKDVPKNKGKCYDKEESSLDNSSMKSVQLLIDGVKKTRQIINEAAINFDEIIKNVITVDSLLEDAALDEFLRIVRNTTEYKTESVQFEQEPALVEPLITEKGLQIFGSSVGHWKCIFYNGSKVFLYDSYPRQSKLNYQQLSDVEKKYIQCRFPCMDVSDIIFEETASKQPDGYSCGIYAVAYATSIALGEDPKIIKYSSDTALMRSHMLQILTDKKLSHFPSES